MGMSSEIAESIHLEHISIRHLGIIQDGVEDLTSPEALKWAPSYENYYLESADDGSIRFRVEVDMEEEYLEEMGKSWLIALEALKSLCENDLLPYTSITVETEIQAPLSKVWDAWTLPDSVTKWNFASPDWHCPKASNDLQVGGRFIYTMAAKDGSFSFDFSGTYTEIIKNELITNQLDDGRMMSVRFETISPNHIKVIETFDAEDENSIDLQRQGWQAILDNFARFIS